MRIVDMIVQLDEEQNMARIQLCSEEDDWFPLEERSALLREPVGSLLTEDGAQGVVEFRGRFFVYQRISMGTGEQILFSQDSFMKQLYEETLQCVSEGIQIFSRNGYLLFGNRASEQLEGYQSKDFVGKHLLDLYNLSEEFSTTLTVLRTGKPVLNRCDRFKDSTGKELTTINSGYPLSVSGELHGAVTFESDLSVINSIRNRSFNLEAFIRDDDPVISTTTYTFANLIHASEVMASVIQFSKKIALTNANILITGETGTGKELIAQSIHAYSPRRDKPFVDVNCSAVPSNLMESLFFGTERGAFTGSLDKKGFFELAEGGTLFLDEINSLELEMQGKLLRVLQEKRYQRVGGNRYHHCNVRVIAASNEDLTTMMQRSAFRKDFYYRVSALTVEMPALRERTEDIPVLAAHILTELCREYGRLPLQVSALALRALQAYSWPGNVRELQHVLEYAVNRAPSEAESLMAGDLPAHITTGYDYEHRTVEAAVRPEGQETKAAETTLGAGLADVEQEMIARCLAEHGGNVSATAKALGLSRQSLQYRLRKYGFGAKSAK